MDDRARGTRVVMLISLGRPKVLAVRKRDLDELLLKAKMRDQNEQSK